MKNFRPALSLDITTDRPISNNQNVSHRIILLYPKHVKFLLFLS